MRLSTLLKSLAATVILAGSTGLQASPITITGFTGDYDPDNWIAAIAGDGFVDTIDAPDSVSLVCYDDCSIDLTIASTLRDATVGFSWDASLEDARFVSATFGFLLNGVFTQIVAFDAFESLFVNAAGSSSFNVGEGDVFGFRLSCLLCEADFWDQADAIISDFRITGTVPEPGTLALLSLGLLGAGAMRRRRVAG